MPTLTAAEKRLLAYPPTRTTWSCGNERERVGEEGATTRITCNVPNPGKYPNCWMCGSPKPAEPKLIWPSYVALCKKAGVEPGTPVREAAAPIPRIKKGTRK